MSLNTDYKPPFVYFGGKSAVASVVWDALGHVNNYVEPFFGSGAVLFLKPGEPCKVETVNDADGFVSNFWRSLRKNPAAVAEAADWPVNEADLHARHLWLLGQRERITERLMGDPDFYDAKVAGWWCWGINCWIGSGWCSGRGPWVSADGLMVLGNSGRGVNRQRPHLGDSGQGVNRQLPHLGSSGQGVNRQRPHLGDSGRGVNRQLPHLGNSGQGVDSATTRAESMRDYLGVFAARLANVRVCCGDWLRVCGPSVTFKHGTTGVFLDPPYSDKAERSHGVYAVDCEKVAHDVREWAIANGTNPAMRIVLAGYEGEHQMPAGWRVHEWKTAGGYASQAKSDESKGIANSERERLWFSPHCLSAEQKAGLFWGVT